MVLYLSYSTDNMVHSQCNNRGVPGAGKQALGSNWHWIIFLQKFFEWVPWPHSALGNRKTYTLFVGVSPTLHYNMLALKVARMCEYICDIPCRLPCRLPRNLHLNIVVEIYLRNRKLCGVNEWDIKLWRTNASRLRNLIRRMGEREWEWERRDREFSVYWEET